MRVIPLGFCLRVIMNEKPINLLKMTYSDLNVLLLIYEKYKENSDWRQTTELISYVFNHYFFLEELYKGQNVLIYKM